MASGDHQTDYTADVGVIATDNAQRTAMRFLLSVSGLKVIEYRSTEKYLSSPHRNCRCLVIDAGFADMSGWRLGRVLADRCQHVPVVVVALWPEHFRKPRVGASNIRAIGKPFEGDRLIEAVQQAIHDAGAGAHREGTDRYSHAP